MTLDMTCAMCYCLTLTLDNRVMLVVTVWGASVVAGRAWLGVCYGTLLGRGNFNARTSVLAHLMLLHDCVKHMLQLMVAIQLFATDEMLLS